jgi:hypothetical protein
VSKYTQRLTLAVPEALIPQANQLALIAGESANDVNTFTDAKWTDESGNLYAVCSTISKPIVLEMLTKGLPSNLETESGQGRAKEALDKLVVLRHGVIASTQHIVLAINAEPLEALKQMGLRPKETVI